MIPAGINPRSRTSLIVDVCHLLAFPCTYIARKVEHIHFVACSNKVSAVGMADALVEDLKALEGGVRVYDAYAGTEVLLIAPVICALCDNIRAAELLNHMGSRARMFCRKCMVQ